MQNIPDFDEEQARKAFRQSIEKQQNHSGQYDPFVVLKKSKTLEDTLKRQKDSLKKDKSEPF